MGEVFGEKLAPFSVSRCSSHYFSKDGIVLKNTLKIINEHSGAPSTWQWPPVAFQALQFDVS